MIYAIGWSIYGYILGSVLAVLGWRYQAGGRPGRVKTVAGGRVKAVAISSNCQAGCGGLYKLSCHNSLALVNEEGKASGAYADRAYTDKAYLGKAYVGEACADKACTDKAYIGGAYAGEVCVDKAYIDGAYRPIILLS